MTHVHKLNKKMEFVSFTHYFCLIIIVVALESSGYKDNDVEENEVEEDKVKEGQEQETSVEQCLY